MTSPRRNSSHRPDWDAVRATEADLNVLSHVIADAFMDLAPSRWLVTDLDARRRIFPGYFRIYLEHALTVGIVHTTPGRTAAALWLPGGPDAPRPPDDYDERLAGATGPWLSRFQAFDEALDRHHPVGIPHQHLAILAVHPDQQERGIGTRLLDVWHATLEEDGTPAYLEASSPRSRDLYLAHGYALGPDASYHLPDGGPPMWPMWRQPGVRPGRNDAQ
jgi:GNAT superfamily N-acetyltransferase